MKNIILDIETTGIPPKGTDYKIDFLNYPRILSIAWKVNSDPTQEFIIAQNGLLIPAEAIAIHGITDQMALDSPHQLESILIELLESNMPSEFIIGFNIYFDTSTIKANILRLIHEERVTQGMYDKFEEFLYKDKRIDLMRICHKLMGGKWPTLSEAYFKLFGKTFEAHTAGADVDACYEIYLELVKRGIINIQPVSVLQEEE